MVTLSINMAAILQNGNISPYKAFILIYRTLYCCEIHQIKLFQGNWVSEASPTLGCSIEISRDIYICACVCCGPKSIGGTTWAKRAHAQSQYWAVKSDQ